MKTQATLSLPRAILINLNIMMGAGIFINTVELSKRTGLLSGFMYPLIGLLILPLIIAIAQLVNLYPAGSFYVFAQRQLGPFMGFVSTWSYFTAKLASAMLMIHVATSLLMQLFPALAAIGSVFIFDGAILALFICLNLLNMKTGSSIQLGFLGFKLIPLLFVIGVGILFFAPGSIASLPIIWSGIPSSLPLVLYAAMGFEAICALSSKIEDAERNGPKAIMYSFGIMIILVFLFQFLFYTFLGDTLAQQTTFLGAFPALLQKLFPGKSSYALQLIFHLAIAFSALGGCYGILYSNNWNLHILAQHQKIRGWHWLVRLNRQAIPYLCLAVEALLCLLYLYLSSGNQIMLQQLAALGTAVTYTISVISLCVLYVKTAAPLSKKVVTICALSSCGLLIAACVRNFIIGGIVGLVVFSALLAVGLLLYNSQKHAQREQH
jgi:amino acid transporter